MRAIEIFFGAGQFSGVRFGRLEQSFPEGSIVLSLMKERVSRLAIVQSVTVFRLILLHGWDTDLGLETKKYRIASFVVSGGVSGLKTEVVGVEQCTHFESDIVRLQPVI